MLSAKSSLDPSKHIFGKSQTKLATLSTDIFQESTNIGKGGGVFRFDPEHWTPRTLGLSVCGTLL